MTKSLLLIIVLFILSTCVTRENPPAKVTLDRKNKDYAIIKIDGLLEKEVEDRLDRAIKKALRLEYKTIIIDLNSRGGIQGVTNRLVDLLVTLKETSGIKLETLVRNESYCMSGCTVLFAVGHKRIAEELATFMFHYGTGGNTTHKYQANAKTFKTIIKLCGKNNKISKIIMNHRNISFEIDAVPLDKICPAYITNIRFKKK